MSLPGRIVDAMGLTREIGELVFGLQFARLPPEAVATGAVH